MDSIYSFCQTLYNCTYLPMHYYKDEHLELTLPDTGAPFDLAVPYLPKLMGSHRPVSYLITKDFQYFGLVQNAETECCVLIGPVISIQPSPESIRNLMKEYAISLEYKELLTELYQFTPTFSFHQFCHFLALIYQEIFGKTIDIESYLGLHTGENIVPIAPLHSASTYESKEEERFHNTYHYEQMYSDFIRTGNVEKLKEFFSNAFSIQVGQLADNTLRHAKNILVVSVTLATRCAIEGGLDIESAYQLSDVYIREGEKLQNIDALYRLQYNMLLDFTSRVAQAQIPFDVPSDIYKCIQYIRHCTNRPLSVDDVANHVRKSRSYISRSFKKELGFSMNAFITRCKLEEAKSLLAYTDKSISEISSYLCFSSQAYFQNVFKKKCGITPNEYRRKLKLSEYFKNS